MVIGRCLLVLALMVAGCSSSGDNSIAIADAPILTEPTIVAELEGSFSNWANFETRSDVPIVIYRLSHCEPPADCESIIIDESGRPIDAVESDFDGERVLPLFTFDNDSPSIAGFESSDDSIALPDGRFLVRGRSAADVGIEGWSQRNPDAAAPGEPFPPIVANQRPPVRLFVYDPNGETLTAVSHWPESRPYSTAISRGLWPDHVLDALILEGGRTVAYTAGFSGAGYDLPYALYLAPIPALT
jgi:hypothetical protein